jgi:hypothetical protein
MSTRLPANREPNRLARAVQAAREAGREPIDLTVTNPTRVGLAYPPDILAPLAAREALCYTPHPFGLERARQAVAADYARRGIAIATDRIVLTASTSEAYSLLFKLLCDPHSDAVLAPSPSYPLFDHLTRLDGVSLRMYRLDYHGRWTLDEGSVERKWGKDVRAVLAVSPNNPTGSILSSVEISELEQRCLAGRAALILDEVFADYPITPGTRISNNGSTGARALTFRLGGLSKSAGLPQVKLGWIAVDGPEHLVRDALEGLELICDTYLSVSTPVQVAADALIGAGAAVRDRILERVRGNYAELVRAAEPDRAIAVLPVDGGWSAVVRVPSTRSEEDLVLDLLERDNLLVHPGFFFDLPHEAFVIVSLLPEPHVFARGVRMLMERAGA